MIQSFKVLNSKTFCIKTAHKIQVCAVNYKNNIPEKIKIHKEIRICAGYLNKTEILITLPKKDEKAKNEYSIIIFYKKNNSVFELIKQVIYQKKEKTYFTEIIRQPPLFVKRASRINKPQGYYILGRSNEDSNIQSSFINQTVRKKREQIPSLFKQKLKNINTIHLDGKVPTILIFCAKICCILQKMRRQVGINGMSYQEYLDLNFEKKISPKFIVPGSFSCQWLRDLFLDATSFFEGIETRALDAFAQNRCYEPLIRCSHAVAEVFCRDTKKWFLIDPWNNYLAKNKYGVFLNGADLQKIAAVDFVQFNLDKKNNLIFKSKPAPSCFICNKTGVYPNYLFYFKNLIYTKRVYE